MPVFVPVKEWIADQEEEAKRKLGNVIGGVQQSAQGLVQAGQEQVEQAQQAAQKAKEEFAQQAIMQEMERRRQQLAQALQQFQPSPEPPTPESPEAPETPTPTPTPTPSAEIPEGPYKPPVVPPPQYPGTPRSEPPVSQVGPVIERPAAAPTPTPEPAPPQEESPPEEVQAMAFQVPGLARPNLQVPSQLDGLGSALQGLGQGIGGKFSDLGSAVRQYAIPEANLQPGLDQDEATRRLVGQDTVFAPGQEPPKPADVYDTTGVPEKMLPGVEGLARGTFDTAANAVESGMRLSEPEERTKAGGALLDVLSAGQRAPGFTADPEERARLARSGLQVLQTAGDVGNLTLTPTNIAENNAANIVTEALRDTPVPEPVKAGLALLAGTEIPTALGKRFLVPGAKKAGGVLADVAREVHGDEMGILPHAGASIPSEPGYQHFPIGAGSLERLDDPNYANANGRRFDQIEPGMLVHADAKLAAADTLPSEMGDRGTVLRVRDEPGLVTTDERGFRRTTRPLQPSELEVYGDDGQWHPAQGFTQRPDYGIPTREMGGNPGPDVPDDVTSIPTDTNPFGSGIVAARMAEVLDHGHDMSAIHHLSDDEIRHMSQQDWDDLMRSLDGEGVPPMGDDTRRWVDEREAKGRERRQFWIDNGGTARELEPFDDITLGGISDDEWEQAIHGRPAPDQGETSWMDDSPEGEWADDPRVFRRRDLENEATARGAGEEFHDWLAEQDMRDLSNEDFNAALEAHLDERRPPEPPTQSEMDQQRLGYRRDAAMEDGADLSDISDDDLLAMSTEEWDNLVRERSGQPPFEPLNPEASSALDEPSDYDIARREVGRNRRDRLTEYQRDIPPEWTDEDLAGMTPEEYQDWLHGRPPEHPDAPQERPSGPPRPLSPEDQAGLGVLRREQLRDMGLRPDQMGDLTNDQLSGLSEDDFYQLLRDLEEAKQQQDANLDEVLLKWANDRNIPLLPTRIEETGIPPTTGTREGTGRFPPEVQRPGDIGRNADEIPPQFPPSANIVAGRRPDFPPSPFPTRTGDRLRAAAEGAMRGNIPYLFDPATTGAERAFDLGSGVLGGVAGAATAPDDATWQDRAKRAALGAALGAGAGPRLRGARRLVGDARRLSELGGDVRRLFDDQVGEMRITPGGEEPPEPRGPGAPRKYDESMRTPPTREPVDYGSGPLPNPDELTDLVAEEVLQLANRAGPATTQALKVAEDLPPGPIKDAILAEARRAQGDYIAALRAKLSPEEKARYTVEYNLQRQADTAAKKAPPPGREPMPPKPESERTPRNLTPEQEAARNAEIARRNLLKDQERAARAQARDAEKAAKDAERRELQAKTREEREAARLEKERARGEAKRARAAEAQAAREAAEADRAAQRAWDNASQASPGQEPLDIPEMEGTGAQMELDEGPPKTPEQEEAAGKLIGKDRVEQEHDLTEAQGRRELAADAEERARLYGEGEARARGQAPGAPAGETLPGLEEPLASRPFPGTNLEQRGLESPRPPLTPEQEEIAAKLSATAPAEAKKPDKITFGEGREALIYSGMLGNPVNAFADFALARAEPGWKTIRDRILTIRDPNARFIAEAAALGQRKGREVGYQQALRSWKTGDDIPEMLPGAKQANEVVSRSLMKRAVARGDKYNPAVYRAVEWPMRSRNALDAYTHAEIFHQHLYGEAAKWANAEAAKDATRAAWQPGEQKWWDNVSYFVNQALNPTIRGKTLDATNPMMIARKGAIDQADRALGRNNPGKLGTALNNAFSTPQLRPFFPIFKTVYNYGVRGIERSPLGFARPLIDRVRGKPVNAEQVVDAAMGSAITLPLMAYAMTSGGVTSYGPDDQDTRDILEAQGWQPYSVKIGDRWVSYRRLGAFAAPFVLAGAFGDAATYGDPDQNPGITTAKALGNFGRWFADTFALRNASDLNEMVTDPVQQVPRWAGRYLSQHVGGQGLGSIAAALDPYERERGASGDNLVQNFAEELVNEIKINTPLLRNTMEPKYDAAGMPERNPRYGPGALNPFPVGPGQDEISPKIRGARQFQGSRSAGEDYRIRQSLKQYEDKFKAGDTTPLGREAQGYIDRNPAYNLDYALALEEARVAKETRENARALARLGR